MSDDRSINTTGRRAVENSAADEYVVATEAVQRWGSGIMAVVATGIGGFWLVAWLTGTAAQWSTQAITPKTNLALALALAGLALLGIATANARDWRWRIGVVLSAVVLAIGALTLSQYIFGWDLGIDQLLASEPPGAPGFVAPNRMGLPATLSLTLLGIGLLSLAFRHKSTASILAVAVITINLVPAIGYLYGITQLYGSPNLTTIAWPTVVALFLLALGLIAACADSNPTAMLLRNDPAGALLRRLLPAALLLPLILGYLRTLGEQQLLYDAPTGRGLLVISMMLLFSILLWWSAAKLGRSSRAEREALASLKESEQRLHQSLERYRLLNEATHDVIWDWDLLTDHLDWNDAVRTAFGMTPEELGPTVEGWYNGIHPEDRDRVVSSIHAAIDSGEKSWSDEYRFKHKDGTYRTYLDRGLIASDADGIAYRMIGSMLDLTERKQMENALRQSEAQFRQLADAMPQLVWITSPSGYHEYFNELWYQYTGTTFDDTKGDMWANLLHPDDYQRTLERWHYSLETGEPYDIEYRFRRASDGTYRWFLGRALPVRNEQGGIVRWFGTCTEIHEQKETQEALRESEERLRLAVEAADLGTWDLDLLTDVAVRSLRHDQIWGYQKPQPEWGFEIAMRNVVPEDRPLIAQAYARGIETGLLTHENRIIWPDGSVHWITVNGRFRYDDDGRPIRVLGVVADTTDRKRAEEEIRRLNTELEQRVAQRTIELEEANRELEAFSYSVSHDLRAPLRAIDGFSNTILKRYRDALDPQGQDYLNRIRAASQRMAQLIEDILGLSRAGRVEMHRQQVNVTALASEILGELRESQPERKAEVMVQQHMTANADAHLLRIALSNLLSNAWKFTGKKDVALIEVGCARENGELIYYVRDNGAGFNPERADKLFAPFQRLHTETEFPGSGIGLALVQRIVRRHGGRIWAESQIDQGSTFYFTLGEADE